ncbi:uncharacterized protein V6R79_016689 [Siganus canaliculatus]
MDRIEEQNADLKLREGQVEQKIQLIETVRSRLQKVTDVLCSNLEKKTISLQENSQGVLALGTVAQQIMSEIGKQKESLTTHRELLEREKELLKNILSDMDTQRQDRNNEQMVKLEMRAKHLENQIAEFKQWRQDLDKMNVMMTTDRQNMEMMMSENVKHNDTLQVLKKVVMDGKDGLAMVRYELQNKMEQLDSLFGEINAQNTHVKDLNIQARKTRGDIENATQTIRLKEKEQDTKDHELKTKDQELKTLKEELDIKRKSVERERVELETLRSKLDKQKEELEEALTSLSGERQELSEVKTENLKAREILSTSMDRIEEQNADLKLREGQVEQKIQLIETVRSRLQKVTDVLCSNLEKKTISLQENSQGVLALGTVAQQIMSEIGKQKESLTTHRELLEREKELLKNILSDMDTQRQDRNNEQMVKLEMRAKHLENQIAEFKQWRQDLDKMNVMMTTDRQNMEMMMSENVKHNDTLQVLKKVVMDGKDGLAMVRYELQNKMEQLDSLFGEINAQNTHVKDLNIQARKTRGDIENATQTIRLKEKEQDTKDHELKTLKEELDIKRKSVERERVELETLRSKLDKQKEELEEALTSLSGERQELSEVKTENLKAREILSTSMDRIEEQNADLKLREGQVEQKIQLIETVRSRLQKVTDVLCSNLEKKTISLQENSQGVLALGTVAQQIMSEIGKQKESLTTHRELLEREKELLKNILSDMDTQRQDRNNEQMVKLEMRAKHLENQIAEFKQWRQDLDKMNVMMTTDRQNMEMMMSENVKHNDTLQVLKKVVMDGKDGLAMVRYELQNKMEQLDSLFGEINAQNTHVKDLNIQARKTRGDIENATQTILERKRARHQGPRVENPQRRT